MISTKLKKVSEADRLFAEAETYEETGDFKRAFKCLLAAAELGDSGGQLNLVGATRARLGLTRFYWQRCRTRNLHTAVGLCR